VSFFCSLQFYIDEFLARRKKPVGSLVLGEFDFQSVCIFSSAVLISRRGGERRRSGAAGEVALSTLYCNIYIFLSLALWWRDPRSKLIQSIRTHTSLLKSDTRLGRKNYSVTFNFNLHLILLNSTEGKRAIFFWTW